MNLGTRAVLHTARKWKKTLLIFCLLLSITTLVLSGLAIADAQEEQAEELRGTTGASFTVNVGIMFVAGCHDAEVLRQSAFPKNERVSAQNSPLRGSNSSLRPFNGKSNCLRTSTHRAKIRIKHNTKSFSCRDWPMIMNSIEGL